MVLLATRPGCYGVVCRSRVRDARSVRSLMEKVGLTLNGEWSLHGRPSVVYAITRETWAARTGG